MKARFLAPTRYLNRHRPRRVPDVVLVASPRSGSTWLLEIILAADRCLAINEPLDLRRANVQRHLPGLSWERLYDPAEIPRLIAYLRAVSDGRLPALKPDMTNPYFRLSTRRTVFKLLHGLEGHIGELAQALDARVIVLLRHPCAVAVSRESLPRLHAFTASPCIDRCNAAQRELTTRLVAEGNFLEQAVLHWCFETKRVLDEFVDDWLMVFYEKLVVQPEVEITRVADFLEVTDAARARMATHVSVPSQSTSKSDAETQRLLSESTDHTQVLLKKWQRKIEPIDLNKIDNILRVFGLDHLYDSTHDMPVGAELGPVRVSSDETRNA